MGTSKKTRSQLPHSVYVRRRIVALLILLVILALIVTGVVTLVRGVSGIFAGDEPDVTQQKDPAPEATPAKSQQADAECIDASVALSADTDAESYQSSEKPKLSLIVKNTSAVTCTVDVGTAQQEFLIASGADRIWSSRDCYDKDADKESAENVVSFKPGEEKRSELEWNRMRSTEGCKAGQPEAKAGTYTLTTKVGKASSDPVTFSLG
ncbi:hypothetical protein LWF01_12845 [Saxibacter everestensis]|uniref:DUF4232 domain-containing protein n=1 Tax=Saxibacter everestensis TaxID=2909229 RepID=A0ABY8QQ81_9MICO|nr:hypothetical protein LWF01_12845 [Brevibacteriaceae bacterium ZFBP1038]